MKIKKLKEIAVCNIAIIFLYIIFTICLRLGNTNIAEIFTVIIYFPLLFLYPLVICPFLGSRIHENYTIHRTEGFFYSVLVFADTFVMFCIPITPFQSQYSLLQIGSATLLPAILSAGTFYISMFTYKKCAILYELNEFYIYSFIIVLLLIPNHIYIQLGNENLLLLFWIIWYYPILFLSALVCPIFGRVIRKQHSDLSTKRKLLLTVAVFFTLLLIFCISLHPTIFSRLLWTGYRTNFYLCALLPSGIGMAGFALTLCLPSPKARTSI